MKITLIVLNTLIWICNFFQIRWIRKTSIEMFGEFYSEKQIRPFSENEILYYFPILMITLSILLGIIARRKNFSFVLLYLFLILIGIIYYVFSYTDLIVDITGKPL